MAHTATYSPEDNKLRLYPECRLPADEYQRVKAAGFIWAPKQELFVAPSWTPGREDFLLELCGEIGDEDTSLVDRAEAKAERLEDLSERKAGEADRAHKAVHSIADHIPLGQPILIGHHSERRARKDAERIHNGMRKAVDCWKASEYWSQRAAGALRLAKYKERPDVRARRIKGLEADKRKFDKGQGEALAFIKLWSHENMTWAFAKRISNDYRCNLSRCYPIAEYPRRPGASEYEGQMGLWSALGDTEETGIITAAQAAELSLRTLRGRVASAERWINHLENRLTYERAMLAESGGLRADRFQFAIGGRVLSGGEWTTITKLNKSGDTLVSVTTNAKYRRIKSLEQITDYEAPTEEQAAKVKAAVAPAPPLCNYPGERFATCTEAEWKLIDSDHKGYKTIEATETTAAHRVRHAIGYKVHKPAPEGRELEPGYCNANRTHTYWSVYITDLKRKDPPTLAPVPKNSKTVATLDDLTADMFNHDEDSKWIKAGIKWLTSTDGPIEHECYQFDTLESVKECARAYIAEPIVIRFSIVTYTGGYKNMRTLYTWTQEPPQPPPPTIPPPETDLDSLKRSTARLVASREAQAEKEQAAAPFLALEAQLKTGIKVLAVPQLFPTPPDLAARIVKEAGIEDGHRVLEPEVGTGNILRQIPDNCTVVVVDISAALCASIPQAPGRAIITGDFLKCEPATLWGKFDRIVMNPPFENAVDIRHVQHAITFLKPGGRLVALCANGPRQRETLKPLAEQSGGWWEDLPAGSFLEQGTAVNVALLVIEAAASAPAPLQGSLF